MGKGIDLARAEAPEHAALIDDLRDQLLIVFLKRLGGEASFPVSEVDDTYQDLMGMRVDENQVFHFSVIKKS